MPSQAASITEALTQVREGGLVLVAPGVYRERVLITKPDVTIRGEDRNRVIIDGEGIRSYGVVGIADGITVENLTVTQATLYGVLITGMHTGDEPAARGVDGYTPMDPEEFPPLQRYRVDHVSAINNGLYGIYAFNAQHGAITNSFASGSADSGIYLGQCEACDALITNNVATRNAVGFENANASGPVTVAGNRFHGNRVGLTLTSDYQEAFVPQRANVVVGNVIDQNQEPQSPAQADGGFGIGIGISGGQGNQIRRNLIADHVRAGMVLTNTEDVAAQGNVFSDNVVTGNRISLINISAARTPATGNCGTVPNTLPANLLAVCDADTANPSVAGLPTRPAPPVGLAFLDVPAPVAQPSLNASDEVPEPLPATMQHPDPAEVGIPKISLFAELLPVR